jgi:hypothetical protein
MADILKEILERKAEGRRGQARLTFAEKLEILDKMRERVRPIVEARKRRQKLNG